MTTTENRSITLPAEEITFLLNLADLAAGDGCQKVSDSEFERLESLRGIVQDTEMPPTPEVFLLMKGDFERAVVRAFASEAEAVRTMTILNEFSSDHFEVESVTFEP